MCSIVASFETEKLKELIQLNSYRGSYSHSIAYFDLNQYEFTYLHKSFGPPDLDTINIPEDHFAICHVQAPTTQAESNLSIHPAIKNSSYLWHNGILKPKSILDLQISTNSESKWDTELLLLALENQQDLSEVDGSFSCIYWDNVVKELIHFRNEISPMYFDQNLNFSSTKFEDSVETPPNIIFEIDLESGVLFENRTFTTKNNPYFFIEEA